MTTEKRIQQEMQEQEKLVNTLEYDNKEDKNESNYEFIQNSDFDSEMHAIGYEKGFAQGLETSLGIIKTSFTQKEIYLTIYSFLLMLAAIFTGLYKFLTYLETTI